MLYWNFSAIVSYADGTWDSVELYEGFGITYRRGPDVSAHPEVVDLLTQLGLPTKNPVIDFNITSIVFRFSATYVDSRIYVVSGIDEAEISYDNLEAIVAVLNDSSHFSDYFVGYQGIQLYAYSRDNRHTFNPLFGNNLQVPFYNIGRTVADFNEKPYIDNQVITANGSIVYRLYSYDYDYTYDVMLDTIDTITGQVTTKSYGVRSYSYFESLTYHQQTNKLYVTIQNTLYRIDSNQFTEIGNMNTGGYIADAGNDKLYWMDYNNGDVYTVDLSDGSKELVTSTTLSPETLSKNFYYSINLTDGHLYAVINYNDNLENTTNKNGLFKLIGGNFEFIAELNFQINSTYVIYLGTSIITYGVVNNDFSIGGENLYEDDIVRIIKDQSGSYSAEVIQDNSKTVMSYSALGYNPDDGYHYFLGIDDRYAPFFRKYDMINETYETINLPQILMPVITNSYISDGSADMYDDGNLIGTDRLKALEYTHQRQSGSSFQYTDNSTIVENSVAFGSGSSYFTNLYDGLFVLVAKNMNINMFRIFGETGADGGGQMKHGVINTTIDGVDLSVYYKCTFNANDPSINQLIIIPTKEGVIQSVPENTDNDSHSISNLSGVDSLYYLLYSTSTGGNSEQDEEEILAVVQGFFGSITPDDNIEATFDALNNSGNNIISAIVPSYISIVDRSSGFKLFRNLTKMLKTQTILFILVTTRCCFSTIT